MSFLSRTLRSSWLRTVLLIALVGLYTGWIGYQFVRNQLYDFNLYYIAADGFHQGIDVYSLVQDYSTTNYPAWEKLATDADVESFAPPYRYPPLTAQLVLPLTALPARSAGMIWLGATAVAFIVSAVLIGRLAQSPAGPALAYLLMFFFVPPLTTLHAGQVNGFVLLALIVAMLGLARQNPLWTGLGIALGTLIKLIPIVLLGYLVWRKQWVATLIAIGIILGLLLTAPLTFAPDTLTSYFQNFLDTGQPGTLFPTPANQSLNGFWARTLTGSLADGTIYRLYLLSVLAVVGAAIVVCWPLRSLPPYWAYEFALIVCVLQLITPYAWYHQLVLLYIPLFVVIDHLWTQKAWGWIALLTLLVVLTNIHGLFWHSFRHITGITSFPFLLTVTLWGMLAMFIWQARHGQRSAVADEQIYSSGDTSA